MKQHVGDLHEHVRTSSGVKAPADEWQTVLRRVRSQLPLRVVSCCRLAGQLVDSCQVNSRAVRHQLQLALKHNHATTDNHRDSSRLVHMFLVARATCVAIFRSKFKVTRSLQSGYM